MITLVELIEQLMSLDPETVCKPGFHNPHSYRGCYNHLAFQPCGSATAGELLTSAREAHGSVYMGYKGGGYAMGDRTPVYIAEPGQTGEGMSPEFIARISGSAVPAKEDYEDDETFLELSLDSNAIAAFVAYGAMHGRKAAKDKLARLMLEGFEAKS